MSFIEDYDIGMNKPDIPDNIYSNWQELVDLLASVANVPSALVMHVLPNKIEVASTSRTQPQNNPYNISASENLGCGLYCETVMKEKAELYVKNALKDENWKDNPDIAIDMISYYGQPLLWPDNTVFGTICILDKKDLIPSDTVKNLLGLFRNSIENDLEILELSYLQAKQNIQLTDLNKKLELKRELIQDESNHLKERLELALIGSNDGIWDWDLVSEETYLSPRWKEIIGYSDDELPNIYSSWASRVHPDDLESAETAIQNNLDGKAEYYECAHRMKHKDGHWVWILGRGKAIFDENGKAIRMTGAHTDITKQKNLEQELLDKKKDFKAIYDGSKDAIAITDIESNILQVNDAYIHMTGMSEEELLATSCIALSAPEDVERSKKILAKVFEVGYIKNYEKRCRVKNGMYINVNMSVSLLHNPTRILISVRDVTQQKNAERNLAVQYNLLNNIVDTVPVRIFWKNLNSAYMGGNKLLLEDAQVDSIDDIIGKNDYEMPWGKNEARLYIEDDLAVMKSGIAKINFEETQTDTDGNTKVLLTSKVPLKDEDGRIIGVLGSSADITKQRNIEKELKIQKDAFSHQAHHDFLTGLPNRILFNDRLNQAIEKAKRKETKVALLFIDLDHFKEINDSLGHETGDEILKEVTTRLANTIRDEDTIARLGGDEFTIIIEDLAKGEDSSALAKKILEVLSKPIVIKDNTLYVSSSIGISIYPNDGESAQNLLKYADSAMYKAKAEGRNNFQFYSAEMTELAFERVLMEVSLREALKNEEFLVFYQPQIDGHTNQLTGSEALVRWNHPTMGLVSPAKFIPLAEATGLIVQLDRYVMKTAMRQVALWHEEGLNPGTISMNLSVKQLQEQDFITIFKAMIIETKCKAQWIELEVTEGQIMKNPEEAIEILKKLSEIGISLAVDDFGTGYSSLAYLKRLPIDKLKIDQSFIRDIPGDEEDSAIAKAVIALSKSLNLKVIAEGVETKEQKEFLVNNGCHNIQGYYYSKPIPFDKMETILMNGLDTSLI